MPPRLTASRSSSSSPSRSRHSYHHRHYPYSTPLASMRWALLQVVVASVAVLACVFVTASSQDAPDSSISTSTSTSTSTGTGTVNHNNCKTEHNEISFMTKCFCKPGWTSSIERPALQCDKPLYKVGDCDCGRRGADGSVASASDSSGHNAYLDTVRWLLCACVRLSLSLLTLTNPPPHTYTAGGVIRRN